MKASLIFIFCATILKLTLCDDEIYKDSFLLSPLKECANKFHVTMYMLKNLYKIDPDEVSQDLKCFHECLMVKLNFMKDGMLDVDRAVKFASSLPETKPHIAKIAESYNSCKSEKGIDDCDTAFKISKCVDESGVNGELLKN